MKQWICIWWYDDYPVWYFNALYIWYHVQKLRHNCNHATKAQSMLRAVVMRAPTHSWSSHCTATRSPHAFQNLPNTRINHLFPPQKMYSKRIVTFFLCQKPSPYSNEHLLSPHQPEFRVLPSPRCMANLDNWPVQPSIDMEHIQLKAPRPTLRLGGELACVVCWSCLGRVSDRSLPGSNLAVSRSRVAMCKFEVVFSHKLTMLLCSSTQLNSAYPQVAACE